MISRGAAGTRRLQVVGPRGTTGDVHAAPHQKPHWIMISARVSPADRRGAPLKDDLFALRGRAGMPHQPRVFAKTASRGGVQNHLKLK